MTAPFRIIFAGTPDFAAKHLDALIHYQGEHSIEIVGVYTQPDRPAGRGKKLQASAVKQLAQTHNLPVYQPENFKSDTAQETLASLQADLMIVVAYGLLLPEVILNTPRLGCINVHGSLLPRWRGAAPIQRAIWAGDTVSGVTIMQMDKGLDTGDMLIKAHCDIDATETSASLYAKLEALGPQAMLDTVNQLITSPPTPEKQDDTHANYAKKLSKAEAEIDWKKPAYVLDREIRSFTPWPISYTHFSEHVVKIHHASLSKQTTDATPGTILKADKHGITIACGESSTLIINTLQPTGKKPMSSQDFLNGRSAWLESGIVGSTSES